MVGIHDKFLNHCHWFANSVSAVNKLLEIL